MVFGPPNLLPSLGLFLVFGHGESPRPGAASGEHVQKGPGRTGANTRTAAQNGRGKNPEKKKADGKQTQRLKADGKERLKADGNQRPRLSAVRDKSGLFCFGLLWLSSSTPGPRPSSAPSGPRLPSLRAKPAALLSWAEEAAPLRGAEDTRGRLRGERVRLAARRRNSTATQLNSKS